MMIFLYCKFYLSFLLIGQDSHKIVRGFDSRMCPLRPVSSVDSSCVLLRLSCIITDMSLCLSFHIICLFG